MTSQLTTDINRALSFALTQPRSIVSLRGAAYARLETLARFGRSAAAARAYSTSAYPTFNGAMQILQEGIAQWKNANGWENNPERLALPCPGGIITANFAANGYIENAYLSENA